MVDHVEACTGCSACLSACPFKAITFARSYDGFMVPRVDKKLCKDCGICDRVCPLNSTAGKRDEIKYYAVQNRNLNQRKTSQSGGLFSAVASVVLAEGGVCYGAGFVNGFKVAQTRVNSLEDICKLQGSKYVQSDPNATFQMAEEDLKQGKLVLYSGTSCLIAGLYSYLSLRKVDTENLMTCDLICHGVPSPKMWDDNIKLQIQKHGNLKAAKFRDKKFGWHSSKESYLFESGEEISEAYYTDLFYSHAALRTGCYNCHYAKNECKPADITMADFWGISGTKIDLKDDNTGISLAVTHTKKGNELLEKSDLTIIEIDAQAAMLNNMKTSPKPPKWRENFWKDYEKHGYEYCLKKYSIYGGIPFKIKRRILKQLGVW